MDKPFFSHHGSAPLSSTRSQKAALLALESDPAHRACSSGNEQQCLDFKTNLYPSPLRMATPIKPAKPHAHEKVLLPLLSESCSSIGHRIHVTSATFTYPASDIRYSQETRTTFHARPHTNPEPSTRQLLPV